MRGGEEKMASDLSVETGDKVTLRETLGLTLERGSEFLVKIVKGFKPSGNEFKHPEGVEVEMRVDKERDRYDHKVTDIATGRVVHEEHETLSNHSKKQ